MSRVVDGKAVCLGLEIVAKACHVLSHTVGLIGSYELATLSILRSLFLNISLYITEYDIFCPHTAVGLTSRCYLVLACSTPLSLFRMADPLVAIV